VWGRQIGTTKGTGGDVLILEEAAYVDPGFFYETVAPLMLIGNTTLLAISTLTSEINFYTRLIRMRDQSTGLPMFATMCIELVCARCKEDGKQTECVHMLHLVPRWQSSARPSALHTRMPVCPCVAEPCLLQASATCASRRSCRTAPTSSRASSRGSRSTACSRRSGPRTSSARSRRGPWRPSSTRCSS
jgi:hypothetical protein